jgi:hypothetical protein
MTFILSSVRAEPYQLLQRTHSNPAERRVEEYQVYVLSRAAELVEARRLIASSDSIALAKTATLQKQGHSRSGKGIDWWPGSTSHLRRGPRRPLEPCSSSLKVASWAAPIAVA